MNTMRAGDVVAQRFEIEQRAATGGMGAIYRARDRVSGDIVALKVLHGASRHEGDRFAREARILAELRHPGLVRYVAHGVVDGVGYLAMEWLEGQVLTQRIAEAPMTPADGVLLARQVAEALAVAHARGVIHRDIKPENLFLPGGKIEEVKVIDFGIARFGRSPSLITGAGIMVGTPRYMAPEQARGAREIDARADVFALGCVLYECLTGQRAFPGDDVLAVLAKVVLDEAPRVRELAPNVPMALDDLVHRMMSKDPAARPSDAKRVAAELSAIEAGPPSARRASNAPRSLLTRGERRFVSVVVAASPFDVDILETIAQDSWEESSELAQRLQKTVAAFGARFEVLADGSMVATLIGQKSPTDQAVLAARCALAIRAEVPDVAMVLASGRGVLAGRVPFGEVIDTAVRMLHEEVPADSRGERVIRLDDVTAGLLDVRFAISGDERGLALRGEREIVEATRTLLGKPTPFVGRERELLTLEALFAECQAESVARGMLVTAAAGVGKSRLRHEFLRKVRESYAHTEIWIARGDPMRAGSPFGMLASAIRRAAGCREGEPLATRQQKLRARVARHIEGDELPRVAEFLGELVGIPSAQGESVQLHAARQDPRLMGDQMRRAWEDFLDAECSAQPLLLVLEDFHWGDLPTVHTIDTALRMLQERPFMVLALARPEVSDLFPRLWQDRGVQHLRLGDLTPRASRKLVAQALGDTVDDATIATIAERAAGNAFYLEELIRSVSEGSHGTLPATVMAMVQTRLERLDSEVRRVLRAASIFGEVFWRGGIVELLGYSGKVAELETHLRTLIDNELIFRRGEGKFPGEEELVFRHAIVRDAAYGMLTARDAELGHRLAGGWLEIAGENEATILAEHFERGALPSRAVGWYRRAAEQALEANAFDAAFERAERGIACGAMDEMLGGLRLLQAQSREWLGKHADAEACGLAALRWLHPGTRAWFVAAGEVATASGRMGDFDALGDLASALNDVPVEGKADGEYVIACARAAIQLLLAGRHAIAASLAARIESHAADFTDKDAAVQTQINLARALQAHFAGDPAEARRLSAAASQSFTEAGDLRHACTQQLNVGYFSGELGAYTRAVSEVREALVMAERMGLSSVATAARHNLGMYVAREGALGEGLALESLAVESARVQGDPRLEGGARIYRAKILGLMGHIDGAASEAVTAVEVCGNSLPARAKALATLAQARLAQNRTDDALTAATEAHAILEQLGGVDGEEETIRLAHAEALHASGDVDAARAAIETARARIVARATKITDATWRRSFLQNVPENARTAALAKEWAKKR